MTNTTEMRKLMESVTSPAAQKTPAVEKVEVVERAEEDFYSSAHEPSRGDGVMPPEMGDASSETCPQCGNNYDYQSSGRRAGCGECGYEPQDVRDGRMREEFDTHMNEDSQEVIFYNSGFGEKPDPSKKQTVNGTLKMGDRGPMFVTNDGIQATWNQDYGWVADMD